MAHQLKITDLTSSKLLIYIMYFKQNHLCCLNLKHSHDLSIRFSKRRKQKFILKKILSIEGLSSYSLLQPKLEQHNANKQSLDSFIS